MVSSYELSAKIKDQKDEKVETKAKKCRIPQDLRVAVFGLCSLCMAEGLRGSYLGSIVTTLERRFNFSAADLGVVFACADITLLASILFTTYCGNVVNKARGIAACAVMFVIAEVMWPLPYFIFPRDDQMTIISQENDTASVYVSKELCVAQRNDTQCGQEEVSVVQSNRAALVIFCMAEVVMGLTIFLPYSLGMTYIEENTEMHKASLYVSLMMGSLFLSKIVAFSLSSAMLVIPENLVDNGMTPDDAQWIGAWWLGWLIQIIFTAPCIVIFLYMPAKFDQDDPEKVDEEKSADTEKKTSKTQVLVELVKGFFVSIWSFLTSPVYLTVVAAIVVGALGSPTFSSKYFQSMFNMSPANTSLVSIIGSVASILGGVVSTLLMAKFKIRLTESIIVLMVTLVLRAIIRFIEIFIYCPPHEYGGVQMGQELLPQLSCNTNCSCTDAVYDPVCADGKVYLSPCYAGCNEMNLIGPATYNLSLCGCTEAGWAINGVCPTDCQMMWPYVSLGFVESFLGSISEAPYMLLIIRTVKREEDRGLAFAFASVIYAICGTIPNPILFGYAVDWACLWQQSSCGSDGSCQVYDMDRFRYVMKIPHAVATVVSCLLYYVAYRMAVKRGMDGRLKSERQLKLEKAMKNNSAEKEKEVTKI